ncbi:MAG: hypothetical protein LBR70_03630 [Lactobacillaceae bacterium]|nr:hypothetical protein [Lactobacillaceae bacterium]
MGSFLELNDTLQISKEQGFPVKELDIKKHLSSPYKTEDFAGKVFEFKNKPAIRLYKSPPVRNFYVQNIDGKWIYWGLVHILEITHDYVNKTTSGKYEIIYINSPEEMKQAYNLIDRREDFNYFA